MADYLSRSPMELAEEDSEDKVQPTSIFTQPDITYPALNNNSSFVQATTAVTRAQPKLQQQKLAISTTNDRKNELIPQGKERWTTMQLINHLTKIPNKSFHLIWIIYEVFKNKTKQCRN